MLLLGAHSARDHLDGVRSRLAMVVPLAFPFYERSPRDPWMNYIDSKPTDLLVCLTP